MSRWFIAVASWVLVLASCHSPEKAVCPAQDGDYWQFMSFRCLKPYPGFNPSHPSFSVIYEDKYILVVSKSPTEAIHPNRMDSDDTLLNEAASYLRAKGEAKGVGYMARIDKDTSGLMVLGKTKESFENLRSQVLHHEFQAYYFALAKGAMKQTVYVDYPLGPDDKRRNMNLPVNGAIFAMKAYPHQAPNALPAGLRRAFTYFYPLQDCQGSTFVKVQILTGITHQIRVHARAIHHPLLGDRLYGGDTTHLKRQFLHKVYLKFIHPHTRQPVEFYAPLSKDLEDAMKLYCPASKDTPHLHKMRV